MIGLDVSIYPKVQIVTSSGISPDEVTALNQTGNIATLENYLMAKYLN